MEKDSGFKQWNPLRTSRHGLMTWASKHKIDNQDQYQKQIKNTTKDKDKHNSTQHKTKTP